MPAGLQPGQAGSLVRHARDGAEAALLLEQGLRFLGKDRRGGEGIPFFEQVLPRIGPGAVQALAEVARYPNLKPLLARVLLDATGEAWGWAAPEEKDAKGRVGASSRRYDAREQPGPYLWVHQGVGWGCFDASLADGMPARVLDPREEVAKTAATVAADAEGTTDALRRALESPYASVRGVALWALAGRGDPGAEALRAFALRDGLGPEDRRHVADALEELGGEAAAATCRELLGTRKDAWAHLWRLYAKLAPDRATDLALDEATGDGEPAFRDVALDVLTEVGDARRIGVFRKILTGDASDARVRKVVETVADQYLIELGPETLRHLRSPNDGIREQATKAIERLKFYADAKRTFESGDAAPGVR